MSCTTILYKIRGQSLDQTPIRICGFVNLIWPTFDTLIWPTPLEIISDY